MLEIVMLFRYVAPEYANTGLLNERSDVYSFGVLLMEVITGRDPVDYGRASGEVWFRRLLNSLNWASSGRSGGDAYVNLGLGVSAGELGGLVEANGRHQTLRRRG